MPPRSDPRAPDPTLRRPTAIMTMKGRRPDRKGIYRKGPGIDPRPSWSRGTGYLISILRWRAFSSLGRVTVRTPSLKSALASSAFTSAGRLKDLEKVP